LDALALLQTRAHDQLWSIQSVLYGTDTGHTTDKCWIVNAFDWYSAFVDGMGEVVDCKSGTEIEQAMHRIRMRIAWSPLEARCDRCEERRNRYIAVLAGQLDG
jgi:hypothetical protein